MYDQPFFNRVIRDEIKSKRTKKSLDDEGAELVSPVPGHSYCNHLPLLQVSQDFLISRVFHKLILKVPQPALECCMIALLKTVQHYEDMAALLGNSVIGRFSGYSNIVFS